MITVTRHFKSVSYFQKWGARVVGDWDLSKEALAQYKAILADPDALRPWQSSESEDYELGDLMELREIEAAEVDQELAAAEDVCRHLSKKLMRLERNNNGAETARYQALQSEYEVTARQCELLEGKLQALKVQRQEISQSRQPLRKQKRRTLEPLQVSVTRTDECLVIRVGGSVCSVIPCNENVRRKKSYKNPDPVPKQERSLRALALKQKLLNQRR
ncbi:hypothetical protein SAMN05444141_101100 [Pseudovibrio denitrificans]|uniref:Uncharacterized protein n=1 Tax=Pseudovibrio denitrificans TaxID=258256 RepID=A0A1I6XD44_9HYPH|nr:hypothetical protein [Pseudovibrio denitrificans]SFT36106.1 hypothetical protein SAMN05444141_101100 [Pseudovibrio denitrificans]